MLKVTENAASHLAKLLEQTQPADVDAIRLEAGRDGWRLTLDQECPGDATFDHDGRKVLLVSASVAEVLEDATLELSEAEDRRSLRLTGPLTH